MTNALGIERKGTELEFPLLDVALGEACRLTGLLSKVWVLIPRLQGYSEN